MGLFDFIKDAGRRISGADEREARAAAASAEARLAAERRLGARLVTVVQGLDLGIEDLSIRVDGDVATVGGTARSQADREKAVLVIGNTQGVARVDDRMTVEEPAPEARFYTVQKGDTLSKIAKAHYGNAMKYPVIFEANRPMLDDPDKIYPGQVLRIPDLED